MAILDEIGRKITKTTQEAVKGTKDFADITRINTLITEEQILLNSFYTQIGKKYYELFPDSEDENFVSLCASISESRSKISGFKDEIQKIKGIKLCPNCNSEIAWASIFCGTCGYDTSKDAAFAQQRLICPGCSKELSEGMAFCTGCGCKL